MSGKLFFTRCCSSRSCAAARRRYRLEDLLIDPALVETYRDDTYVTLRPTSSMYYRFHAPHDAAVERVTYVSGDTWNVNPIALRRVERPFCRNERAVLRLRLGSGGHSVTLVPVTAILVAGIHLHYLDVVMNMNYCVWPTSPVPRAFGGATNSAGSSTGPRSSSSHRAASACATASSKARRSGWVND
jgi:phosphatidylserine decarboxylase